MLTRVISGPLAGSVDTAPRYCGWLSIADTGTAGLEPLSPEYLQVDARGQIVFFIHSKSVKPHAIFTFEIPPVHHNPPWADLVDALFRAHLHSHVNASALVGTGRKVRQSANIGSGS